MKAWSQNLGHENVMTTFTSYGHVPVHKQGELIRNSATRPDGQSADHIAALEALLANLRKPPASPES